MSILCGMDRKKALGYISCKEGGFTVFSPAVISNAPGCTTQL